MNNCIEDLVNEEYIISLLQKYIPLILENQTYFKNYVDYLLKKCNFEVNEEHLRKKLNIYLKNSFRNDPVRLAQRLIRGEYQSDDSPKENWIWLSSKDIGMIAHDVVEKERS